MLQNRVDPEGHIFKTSARGSWMGNRGQLHDNEQNVRRCYKMKAWITCLLEFKNWKRPVMAPGRYTELFFFDEATAFSAGHRPCCECRRDEYNRFKYCWLKGNSQHGFHGNTSIREIDNILHRERMDHDGKKITYQDNPSNIPAGTFILPGNQPYLVADKLMYSWSPFGYHIVCELPKTKKVTVLTPKSIVKAFCAGYTPQTGETAQVGAGK